jgi:hypothetical protein
MRRSRPLQPQAVIECNPRMCMPERSPEQIALIALQSLLEAREIYIDKLEVLFTLQK